MLYGKCNDMWVTVSLVVARTECSTTWYTNSSVKLAVRKVVCCTVKFTFLFLSVH